LLGASYDGARKQKAHAIAWAFCLGFFKGFVAASAHSSPRERSGDEGAHMHTRKHT
jgi:hypothetical protein